MPKILNYKQIYVIQTSQNRVTIAIDNGSSHLRCQTIFLINSSLSRIKPTRHHSRVIVLTRRCISGSIIHYNDAIMGTIASQITSLTTVYSTVYSGADQRKHQSSTSLAFVRSPVNFPHKWPVTWKMFPFDDVIMLPPCSRERWIDKCY